MEEKLVEEVLPRLYRVSVPLPGSPLKSVNSYVIKGEDRNLIIDTGMNRPECKEVLLEALKQLDIDPEITDLFITHVHADHLGLVHEVASLHSYIYFNLPDMELARGDIWKRLGRVAAKGGFPVETLRRALERHPGNRYSPSSGVEFTYLVEGNMLEAGGYSLQCLETPGHTPGSICLYEADHQFIITGDHVLGDITPNISAWLDGFNSLKHYFSSLDKIYNLPVRLVLPGHRSLFTDLKKRIKELKEHHARRLEEVREILEGEEMDAYQVASFMSWDIDAVSWNEFPVAQQWFAAGEALAHLKYMEENGEVESRESGEKILYRLGG